MLAIVQARLSSERLPGKVLVDVCGRTLLARVVDRVSQARLVRDVVVATSTHGSDDAVAVFCAREGIECRRGPLDDVAERLRCIAAEEGVPAFVRISADSPLLDPALIDRAIRYYEQEECDLVTNVLVRTFPKGQSVEVLRYETFERLCRASTEAAEREHVTGGFYARPGQFRIVSFTSGMDAGGVNLCIDTAEDLARMRRILDAAGGEPRNWQESLRSYRAVVAQQNAEVTT